ncbi:MAG: hydantoinase/oxoprolinase family protein [Candidatus Heimdallarchaeota archaeon]|nr:MAG: hydantoinase/oxoprolinase family protein [Candidatus Heimdallarchaeota archaeon]
MKCLGIDIGGTFTDLIIVDSESNSVLLEKVSSTPKDQSIGVKNGLNKLETTLNDLDVVVHGTTVATNAILEHKGAKTALITTEGFSDIIEIGRQNRMNLYSLYPKRIAPLVPSQLRFGVKERISSSGEILVPLNVADLEATFEKIKRVDVESVAISLLFSFFNPQHEIKITNEIKKRFPSIHVSCSSQILPQFREYDRTSTTLLDAYIAPLCRNYFTSFMLRLKEHEINVPPLILLSTGGVTQIKNAAERSVETIFSGLAGGVLGGYYSCNELQINNALTLDIGGTSTDVASIVNGKIDISTVNEIAGHPIHLPSIAVQTIGAGGGSIARYEHGILLVGPESAGADPGPACYDCGGQNPTVTDANLVRGLLNPDFFCGGTIKIYSEFAEEVISSLAYKLNFSSVEECAAGIIEIFENNIALALRKVSTERGYDSRDFHLISFGGAGPLHGCSLAERLCIEKVIIPPYPGVWSAYGLLAADIRHDLSMSILKPLKEMTNDQLESAFQSLVEQGVQLCVEDGFLEKEILIARNLDLRLVGQSYELNVPFYGRIEAVSHAFDEAHKQAYGYASPDAPREVVNLRVAAMVPLPKFSLSTLPKGSTDPKEAQTGTRKVFLRNEWIEANIYQKSKLKANNIIEGPSIIEQNDSTTLVDIGWVAEVKNDSHLLLKRLYSG